MKGFPVGTLAVNLAGCLFIGILYSRPWNGSKSGTALFLAVGPCGGFTPFSTFINENFLMAQGEQFFTLLYAVMSLVGGFLAVWLGCIIVKIGLISNARLYPYGGVFLIPYRKDSSDNFTRIMG